MFREHNSNKRFKWTFCLRALEADPAVSAQFLPEHKNPEMLREAFRREKKRYSLSPLLYSSLY
jgi:hypothetical protein